MRFLRLCLLPSCVFFLLSCGGGGSGDSKATEPPVVEPPKPTAVISGSPLLSLNENTKYSFQVETNHFDTQSISYSIDNLPSWAVFDSVTGLLSGTPSYSDAGVYADITISASDGVNQASLSSFSIDVVNVYELSGVVVDGYIQGAIVYVDSNNNALFDDGEISAITDSEGKYLLYCPPEKVEMLEASPIRAYLGEGAIDVSRPELDFSEVPITLSLAPITLQIEGNEVKNKAVISPYTNEIADRSIEQIEQLIAGSITKEEFRTNIDTLEESLVSDIISDKNLDLTVLNKTEEELREIVFGDFILMEAELPEIVEEGQRKVDLVVIANDLRDFDGDNIPNNTDPDDDNDGVEDTDDLFRFDALESSDSDLDGVGDNGDAYPSDVNCHEASQGNLEVCYETFLATETIRIVETNGENIFYFLTGDILLTFDKSTNSYLNVQEIGNVVDIEYSESHQRLYIGFNDGVMSYLASDFSLSAFSNVEGCVKDLISADSHLIALDCRGYSGNYVSFNMQGTQLGENTDYYDSSTLNAWNSNKSIIHHFRDGISPRDVYSLTLNSDGSFGANNDSPYHSSAGMVGPISVSYNGEFILLGDGDLFDAESLVKRGKLFHNFTLSEWLSDNSLVTFDVSETHTDIVRLNTEFRWEESLQIQGQVIAVFSNENSIKAIVKHENNISYYDYLPNDDSDSDGVFNTEDAFPLDPAASNDSDGDGYPDAWNDGFTATDSTSNLTLDEFINDSACWLVEHGIDGNCDFSATMPIFTPDQIIDDGNGTIFLLSTAHNKIYVWSSNDNTYRNPINVGNVSVLNPESPRNIAFSNSHQRLYLGYPSGNITYIDMEDLNTEVEYNKLEESVISLNPVGNFLLAVDNSGAGNTHYVFDVGGNLIQSEDWKNYSHSYAWNEENNRLYYGNSHNLISEEINQIMGTISDETESPYYYGLSLSGPVKISHEGERIFLGSGDVFDASSLEIVGDLGISVLDVISMPEVIITLRRSSDTSNGLVEFWHDETYQLLGSHSYSGIPLSLIKVNNDIVVISQGTDGFQLAQVIIADHDQDGIPGWWESIYLLDDSDVNDALLDPDSDGLTNLQEFEQLTHPNVADSDADGIEDGAEVNTYNTNPLNIDSDDDGLSDGVEINQHNTNPLLIDTDGDSLSDSVEINDYDSNPLLIDSDSDGIRDDFEVLNGLDINNDDSALDPDEDGLSNIEEYIAGTDTNIIDTDRDGLSDGDEVLTHLTLPLVNDSDSDRMPDGWEVLYGLDPLSDTDANLDEDEDTYSNQTEFFVGTDPIDALSVPKGSNWTQHQGNATHNGFIPIYIPSDELALRWSKTVDNSYYYNILDVVANESRVFTKYSNNSGNYLISLDAKTGDNIWSKNYENHAISKPSLNESSINIVKIDHGSYPSKYYLEEVTIDSGELINTNQVSESISSSVSPTVSDSLYWFNNNGYALVKFDTGNDALEWTIEDGFNCSGGTYPSVDDDGLYFFTDKLNIVEKTSGEIVTSSNPNSSGYSNCDTPVLSGSSAFIINNNNLYTYDKHTAELMWEVNTISDNDYIMGEPTVALGKVYVLQRDPTAYRSHVSVYNEYTGELLWTWSPDNANSLTGNIVASLNLIFVQDGVNTYALDIETQQQVWSYPKSGVVALSSGSALYISSSDGTITAIDFAQDSDNDGMDDWWEDLYGLDKSDASDADLNADTDDLTNIEEFDYSTNPTDDDSDSDGLSDSDEVNTHLSNPINADSDGDLLPDSWEVNNSLNLIDASDAVLDADGDLVSNLHEYFEGTDPNDEASLPTILVDYIESFEGATIPAEWSIDSSKSSGWGVSSISSSDGDYSAFSSGDSAIEYSAYFTGNSMAFDVKSYCGSSVRLGVAIDGLEVSSNYHSGESWGEYMVDIPRGRHTVSISVQSCGVYLDNIRFSESPHLFETNINWVGVTDYSRALSFYSNENELIKSVQIPEINGSPMYVANTSILSSGDVALVGHVNSQDRYMVIYSPRYHTWSYNHYSSDGYYRYDALASHHNDVFVADTNQNSTGSYEILRFDIVNNSRELIEVDSFYTDLYVKNNYLYGLTNSSVDIYNIDTMALESSYPVSNNSKAIGVDSNGNIYIYTQANQIRKYDETGIEVSELGIGISYYNNSVDIHVDDLERIHVVYSSTNKIIINESFTSYEADNFNSGLLFLSFLPFIDGDDDGMPLWWENKYGLSDDDANDALTELDTDGLSNLNEFLNNTAPTVDDTDADGLNDFEEVDTYLTDPSLVDTDGDGLSDGDEVSVHLTDPLLVDTDGDSFSDSSELNLYETDPLSAESMPPAIESLTINFDDNEVPAYFETPIESSSDWFVDNGALRAGVIVNNQSSSITLTILTTAGTLSFDSLLSSESCCDRLFVYVNGEEVVDESSQQTETHELQLEAGENIITFSYSKDGSVSSGSDTVWIDNIVFQ